MFDVGTFWFIFTTFLLMLMSSLIFNNSRNVKILFLGFILSSVFLIFFQILHLFLPNMLSFGILSEKISNILGSWNALAFFTGLFVIISIFILDFFSISKLVKILINISLVLSLFLIFLINFSTVWIILGIFALLLFIYKISFSIGSNDVEKSKNFPVTSFIIVIISLVFFISGQFISGFLPQSLQISNNEVRPSFSTTLSVTKLALIKDPVLGIGANKFNEIWNVYKPKTINDTKFWNTSFNEGFGLVPTFFSTTGIFGILTWVIFFGLLISIGLKLFFSSHREEKFNIKVIVFYIMSLYLFFVSFFYPIGPVLFLLAFAFLGVFIGIYFINRINGEVVIYFLDNKKKSFLTIFFLFSMIIFSISIVFKYIERFVSISYFQKAMSAETMQIAEYNINKAISLYSNDLYLSTYAQIYLLKANSLILKVTKGSSLTDIEKGDLQISFNQALKSAQLAVEYNNMNYLNFETLGSVYEAGFSFGITDAFTKAVEAYNEASKLNPLNPSLKINLARLYFNNKEIQKAKDFANESLSLKSDYLDGLITLSQIYKNENNNKDAIIYAEKALYFYPENKDLKEYLNYLTNQDISSDNSGVLNGNKIPILKKQ